MRRNAEVTGWQTFDNTAGKAGGYAGFRDLIFHKLGEVRRQSILRVAARLEARLEGREFRVAEVAEIAYDEEFPEETFRLQLPGVRFERRER